MIQSIPDARRARALTARTLTVSTLARAAAVTATALALLTAVLAVLGGDVSAFVVPSLLGWAWMGWVLLNKRPGHPMGPLLCLIALAEAVPALPFAYARYALVHSPGSLPFGIPMLWVTAWAYAPGTSLSGLVLPMVFPDGKLPSPRWRPALWAALAFIPLAAVGGAFIPQSMSGYFHNLPDPYAVPAAVPVLIALLLLGLACAAFAAVAAAVAVVQRWRRAGRVQRQQLKWFVAVLPLTGVGLVSDVFANGPASSAVTVSLAIGSLGNTLMPLAIGVAVLRYRLYEIDILLNRAVLYGLLSAAVTGVYLAVVGTARVLFGPERGLPVQILATVLAGAVFWPFRDRLQRRVNRLLFGDRGAPYDALRRLGRRMAEAADSESALDSVARTIADSLRLPYAAIELRLGDGWALAAAYGEPPPQIAAFPLISQRESVGRLLVGTRPPGDQLAPDDERLLADLARHAGPAACAVALRRALDVSMAGLVTAREEERRRLRRDLHDGLGPTLAGLTLGLDTASALAPDEPGLRELLCGLKAETQRAVADVRRIVYGLRPPALDELGLAGALREETARLRHEAPGLAVTLDIHGDGLADLPAAAEVACYHIVTEALANVGKHAHAASCLVRIRLGRGIDVEVCDDGAGLPCGWRAGAGIASMRERVAELGGTLAIGPGYPRGTQITARLPARELS